MGKAQTTLQSEAQRAPESRGEGRAHGELGNGKGWRTEGRAGVANRLTRRHGKVTLDAHRSWRTDSRGLRLFKLGTIGSSNFTPNSLSLQVCRAAFPLTFGEREMRQKTLIKRACDNWSEDDFRLSAPPLPV